MRLVLCGNIRLQEMQILGADNRSKFLGARLPVIFLPIKNKHFKKMTAPEGLGLAAKKFTR